MKFDSYNRFLKSDIYKDCVVAESHGKLFPYEDEIEEEYRNKVCTQNIYISYWRKIIRKILIGVRSLVIFFVLVTFPQIILKINITCAQLLSMIGNYNREFFVE